MLIALSCFPQLGHHYPLPGLRFIQGSPLLGPGPAGTMADVLGGTVRSTAG